jgi:drug/metabolite transporter (DMT)-like permease
MTGERTKPRFSREALAAAVLLTVTFFWGTTFLVVKDATAAMPVMAFLGWRFLLAALVMTAIRPRAVLRLPRREVARGVAVGLVLAAAFLTQTYGLRTTPASVSGFLTGMFLVFTPLLAWLVFRRRVAPMTWIGIGIALVGLGLISLNGFGIAGGEALTLVGAVFFSIQLVLLERWSTRENAFGLAVVQIFVVAGVCAAGSGLDGGMPLPPTPGVWWGLVYSALGATAFAYFGQTWAQSILPASRCAVIMTMEPVFAGLSGVIVGGDSLTVRLVVGAACILGAMLLIELAPRRSVDATFASLDG